MKAVDRFDYGFCLLLSDNLAYRYAQLLSVDALGYGQDQVIPTGIALLFVRRYGIVYQCLDSV